MERVKDRNVKLHTPVVGGCAPLEPYHSHFLLVDDGSSGRPGGEIAYRSAFLAELCNRKLRAPVMPIYESAPRRSDYNASTTCYKYKYIRSIHILSFHYY